MDVTDIELGWNKLCLSGQDRVGLISDAADHELILRITGGESELFAELVKRYQKKVAALIYSLIQHPDEVEDVAQEVFITIYRHLGRFEHRSSFSTWIYRITVNKCHDWQRRNYRQKGRFGTVADKDVDLTMVDLNQTEDCLLVRQQVGKLDEKYRIVIVLYYFHGLKCREIAGILELPTKSVETRLFRARKLLALNMGREINGGNR
ncbi:MAG: RNA polymerase sigma factor [Methanomassiliicoccales archaeon]